MFFKGDLGQLRRPWLLVVLGLFLFGASSAKNFRQVVIVESLPLVLTWLVVWNWLVFGRANGRRPIPRLAGFLGTTLAAVYFCIGLLVLKPLGVVTVGLIVMTVPWMVASDWRYWTKLRDEEGGCTPRQRH